MEQEKAKISALNQENNNKKSFAFNNLFCNDMMEESESSNFGKGKVNDRSGIVDETENNNVNNSLMYLEQPS